MSSLADLFRARYAARLSIPADHRAQMGMVQARYGSNRKAARAVGVDERTWRRWLAGSTPRPTTAVRLAQGAQTLRAEGVRFNFQSLQAIQRQRGARDRTRTITALGLNWDPAANRAVEAALRRGEWGEAARAFLAGIRDWQYQDLFRETFDADGEVGDDDYLMYPVGITA